MCRTPAIQQATDAYTWQCGPRVGLVLETPTRKRLRSTPTRKRLR